MLHHLCQEMPRAQHSINGGTAGAYSDQDHNDEPPWTSLCSMKHNRTDRQNKNLNRQDFVLSQISSRK